jgi:hypothetical protein
LPSASRGVTADGPWALFLLLGCLGGADALGRYHGRGRSPVASNVGRVAGVLSVGRWSFPALTVQPPGLAIGPGIELPHRPVPATISEATENASGVVARSDVDAVPGHAGQGGGPVMRHDGGDGGVNPPG